MGRTIISDDGRFEWDEDKNQINIEKHGFPFSKVLKAFDDPFFLEEFDFNNSHLDEERLKGIGSVEGLMVVFTSFTERGMRTRLISARLATPYEEKKYNERRQHFNS